MSDGSVNPSNEYWIGEGVNYDELWAAYESGEGYIRKYHSMRVHLLRITLREQSRELPLFNFEVVFKTLKGYFHDLKKNWLTQAEYNSAGPLFIYQVDRASGVWDLLGELRQLLMYGTSLSDEKLMGERLTNIDKRVEFLRKNFGNAISQGDVERFMSAKTPRQLDRAMKKLFSQGIQHVEVSTEPFEGEIRDTEATLVDLKRLPDATDAQNAS
jgi:hypothetical protein